MLSTWKAFDGNGGLARGALGMFVGRPSGSWPSASVPTASTPTCWGRRVPSWIRPHLAVSSFHALWSGRQLCPASQPFGPRVCPAPSAECCVRRRSRPHHPGCRPSFKGTQIFTAPSSDCGAPIPKRENAKPYRRTSFTHRTPNAVVDRTVLAAGGAGYPGLRVEAGRG